MRAGFLSRGITYGLTGILAFAVAFGAGTMGAAPSQQGALALIAQSLTGRIALVAICAGLLAYATWKLTRGVLGWGPESGQVHSRVDRIGEVAGGVAYLVFFAVAVHAFAGSLRDASGEPQQAAAGVLGWPAGQEIVGASGIALILISVWQAYDAICGKFARDCKTQEMARDEERLFMVLGRIGLVARALVFVLLGYFLLRTAIQFDARNTVGVDGALARIHQQAFGAWLVGLVAAGLMIFAVFSLFEARYRRL